MSSSRNYTRSRGSSSSSSASDWSDAITPCPSPEPEDQPYGSEDSNTDGQHPQCQERSSSDSRPSTRGLHGSADSSRRVSAGQQHRRTSLVLSTDKGEKDAERLWARMLELQQMYGCYNSARMQAALEEGGSVVPSMACLELINDGVTMLPEEAEQLWNHWMALDSGLHTPAKPGKRRMWKRR